MEFCRTLYIEINTHKRTLNSNEIIDGRTGIKPLPISLIRLRSSQDCMAKLYTYIINLNKGTEDRMQIVYEINANIFNIDTK